jgi:GNAT superfamily N-acetyltransferase
MSMGTILRWCAIANPESIWDSLTDIFFLTSAKKAFSSEIERRDFLRAWTGIYLEFYPDHIFVSISESGELQGYLTGCPDTMSYQLKQKDIPYLDIFQEFYAQYPAHLHINCHPSHQGKGVGRRLIEAYIALLAEEKISGLHIITAANAANVNFYKALGFSNIATKTWKNSELLFMGRDIEI